MESKRDIIIIVKGGTIQGIFSAGVLATFEKHNLYTRIHSVYGVSAGSHNAAYFVAHQTKISKEIYFEHLSKKDKVIKELSPKIVLSKLWQFLIHKKSFDIINLDYLLKIETAGPTKLDIEKISNAPFNFYVRAFNPKTLELEYLDAKVDTLNHLIQSAEVPPYAYTGLKNKPYYDGGIMPSRDFIKNVILKHPNKQILYIFNDKKSFWRVFRFLPWDLLDMLFKARYFGARYCLKHFFSLLSYPYVDTLAKYKNVTVVYDEVCTSKREMNLERISKSYEHGLKKGEDILKKINFIN